MSLSFSSVFHFLSLCCIIGNLFRYIFKFINFELCLLCSLYLRSFLFLEILFGYFLNLLILFKYCAFILSFFHLKHLIFFHIVILYAVLIDANFIIYLVCWPACNGYFLVVCNFWAHLGGAEVCFVFFFLRVFHVPWIERVFKTMLHLLLAELQGFQWSWSWFCM